MEQLELTFDGERIHGTGVDVVGPFRLDGICENGQVAIVKQYIGQHSWEYHGTTDGEGTLYGDWGWGAYRGGKWLIRLNTCESKEVVDITEAIASQAKSD